MSSASKFLTVAEAKTDIAKLPKIGDVYEFDCVILVKTTERLIVVDVTDEHVLYKFINPDGSVTQRSPHWMTHEVWKANTGEHRKVNL